MVKYAYTECWRGGVMLYKIIDGIPADTRFINPGDDVNNFLREIDAANDPERCVAREQEIIAEYFNR